MSLPRTILAGIEQRLRAHAGLELPEWVVESRATSRMETLGMEAADYLDLVRSGRGAGELALLLEAVRVGETRFFRHQQQVDALLEVVVPAWKARGEREPRVWSAGCASGEEPYTLAMVLARAMPRPAHAPAIVATDVSADAIRFAKRGAYPLAVRDKIPPLYHDALIEEGATVRVRPEVAALVSFARQNLADPDQPRGFDLVWCRNVLIYFGEAERRAALEKLARSLAPGGFLFLGYSETLRDAPGLRPLPWNEQTLWEKADDDGVRAHTPVPLSSRRTPTPASARMDRKTNPFRITPPTGLVGPPSVPLAPPSSSAPRAVTVRATSQADELSNDIGAALRRPGLTTLVVDLDAAELLDDAAAPILRRARGAAESLGIKLEVNATKPGHQRWLRRHGLGGDP